MSIEKKILKYYISNDIFNGIEFESNNNKTLAKYN